MRFAALRQLGLRKTAVGRTPFVQFFFATFGAGVVATQNPITCPKRQLQPERYISYVVLFREIYGKELFSDTTNSAKNFIQFCPHLL
ncbi:MAG: hypothetical protein LBV17_08360 [Treponema sp.]|jgi:hypothetical protein|nr:hypothetical protein [Treponema sp.]